MSEYVSITVAAKRLRIAIVSVKRRIERGLLIGRKVTVGHRQVTQVELGSLERHLADLGGKLGSLNGKRRLVHPIETARRDFALNGYVLVYQPDHPRAQSHGLVYEHTLVMEKMIGRFLSRIKVVDHINGIRFDNRPENLRLCSSHADHKRWEYFKPLVFRGGDPQSQKLCTGCDTIQPRQNFQPWSPAPDGLAFYCRGCKIRVLSRSKYV